jgi:hypothetical protein
MAAEAPSGGRGRTLGRRPAFRLLFGLALVEGAWLVLAHLFLLTPAGPWLVSRQPERFHLTWRLGWSLVPGQFFLYDATVGGQVRSRSWQVTLDRARVDLDLLGLLRRRVDVGRLVARGVDVVTSPASGAAIEPRPARAWPWRIALAAVDLEELRSLAVDDLVLIGDGHASGDFDLELAGPAHLRLATLTMADGRLRHGGEEVAVRVALSASGELGPYAPRQHRGLAGLELLSGHLTLTGDTTDRQIASSGAPGPSGTSAKVDVSTERGRLALELEVAAGRLLPGSSLLLDTSGARVQGAEAAGSAALRLTANVTDGPAGPRLALAASAPRLALALAGDHPATFEATDFQASATTTETRLAVILRRPDAGDRATGAAITGRFGPLVAELSCQHLRLQTPVGALAVRLTADSLTSKLDLGALAEHTLLLDKLRGTGVEVGLTIGNSPEQRARRGNWRVELADAELTDVRVASLDQLRLSGAMRLAVDGSWDPTDGLAASRLELALAAGELFSGSEQSASKVELELAGSLDPTLAATDGTGSSAPAGGAAALLGKTSGNATLAAHIESLAFLERFLLAAPWLGLDGRGRLQLGLRLEHGHLVAGSHLELAMDRVTASLFGTVARGKAAASGTVRGAPGLATLDVQLREFSIRPADPPQAMPYLTGRQGLHLVVATRDLDLAAPTHDLTAVISLDDAVAPDLRAFDRLLPERAGITLGGQARASLHLDLDAARQTARGNLALDTDQLALGLQDLAFRGHLAIRLALAGSDLARRRFALDGSTVELANVSWRRGMGADEGAARESGDAWWARASLAHGQLTWGRPLDLASDLTLALRDSAPLVAIVEQRKRLPDWVARVFTVADVRGHGRLAVTAEGVIFDDVAITGGDDLEILSRLALAKGGKRADLYVKLGILGLGVELVDGKRDLELIRPRAWYDARPSFLPARTP